MIEDRGSTQGLKSKSMVEPAPSDNEVVLDNMKTNETGMFSQDLIKEAEREIE